MNYACKVSVIIPVCNMANYLEQAISCWTSQTLKDIEIICIDDGSSDESLQKLQKFAQKDSRIQVYSFPENRSAWCARKLGIEKACGEYIMFADADDTVLPETCEELYTEISASQADILHFQADVINVTNMPEWKLKGLTRWLHPHPGRLSGDAVFTSCFRDGLYNFTLWDKIYRTSVCKACIRDAKDMFLPRGQDKLLFFMLSCTAQSYLGIRGKAYYQYYAGRGGLRNVYTLKQFENFCHYALCVKEMDAYLKKRGMAKQYEDILEKNRRSYLRDNISQWFNVTEEDKASGFDMMLSYWRPDEVIGMLAEMRFSDKVCLAKLLQNCATLKYNGHPVKTIAAYYYRIANGGVQRVLCQLCGIWQAMGYKVIVLTDKNPCEDDYELPPGTERIVIPDCKTITPQNYHKRAEALQRLVTDYHIDAVVYHAWVDSLLFWDQLAIKAAGAACIIHCHNIFPVGMLWMNRYDAFLAQYTLADAVVALSQTDFDFWKYYNANGHSTNNPLSDDISKWKPAPFTASHKILWVGRLSPEKNPMDVLPVMQEVVKAVPDAVLTIVGKSENGSTEKQLQEHISRLHLEEHIRLEGFHTDVRPWYLASQVFLMTSSLEGYSMTLQESKMAGIPCVMYELPYLTLCDGNRGIISVPQRDTQAAAQAIIRLLQNDALCEQYGRDARAHIEELAQFDFKKKWQQIFESVEQTQAPIVSKAEQLMMETLIDYHDRSLQKAKDDRDREISRLKQELDSRNREIHQLRHGSYIRRVARAVVPNRAKPFLKSILHRIPQGIKTPLKRLLRW